MAKVEQRECDRCHTRVDQNDGLAGGWATLRWDEWTRNGAGQEPREADICPGCVSKIFVVVRNQSDIMWWGTTLDESRLIREVLENARRSGVPVPKGVIDMLVGVR